MQLEPRTLLTLMALLALVFTLLAVAIWWTRRRCPGFGRWTAASFLLLVSIALYSLRPQAPDWITVLAANAFLFLASVLYLEGVREFRALPPRFLPAYAAAAAALTVIVYFDYRAPNLNIRAAVVGLFVAFMLALAAIAALRSMPPRHRFGLSLTGGMFALCSATHLLRAAYFYFAPVQLDLFGLSWPNGALLAAMLIEVTGFSLGLILLADETTVADLQDSKHREALARAEIADYRKVEAMLRESEERFRIMADNAPVMIWMTGPDRRATFFNKRCVEFTGASLKEKLGDGWRTALHPEDHDRFVDLYSSSIEARQEFRSQVRLRRADGEYRWILCSGVPRFDLQGAFGGFIGSCVDVTDQKRIEERLRASEARLLDAQRLAKVGNWEVDVETGERECSDEMLQILGRKKEEIGSFRDVVHPGDLERFLDASHGSRSNAGPVEVEYRIVRPDGSIRYVRSSAEAVRDQDGRPVRIVGATMDITDLKRAQEQLFARQKLESLGTLAGGIAHDFNNLLGAVLAQAEVALMELAAGARPSEELEAIRRTTVRGAEIVRQLMFYAGQENESPEFADLSAIVGEMLELLKFSISKHARLEISLCADLPAVRANPAQLRQIVMNLVTNASDAIGDRDGVIRLATDCVNVSHDSAYPSLDGLAEGQYVRLQISDTGQGMPAEMQARAFDPFFSTKAAGRGLGLAVVQGIVRGLRGTIHLESEPGKGAAFQISLPAAQSVPEEIAEPARAPEESAPLRRAAVLVVEDEDSLRQAVSSSLRKAGFSVIEAADGSAALDVIRRRDEPVDILLLDITLPGTPSREVFQEAKCLRPAMAVIVTSAYGPETAAQSLHANVEHFLRKPYPLAEVLETIRSTSQVSHSTKENNYRSALATPRAPG